MKSYGLKYIRIVFRSKICCLRVEDMNLVFELGWYLSLVGFGIGWCVVCRFVNYYSVFMGRILGVFVGVEF